MTSSSLLVAAASAASSDSSSSSSTTTAITRNALGLLYEAEFFLRRQLQATSSGSNGEAPTLDGLTPGLSEYSQPPPTTEETSQSRGRTVLTILYLCVLGLCFVVPVFYYFRLHCFEEHARRELELDFTAALEQSEQHREENRAARRKYIEERRARIVQLMMPVRMILKEQNFPHLVDGQDNLHSNNNHGHNSNNHNGSSSSSVNHQQRPVQRAGSFLNLDFESEKYNVGKSDESATQASEDILSPYASDDEDSHQQRHDNQNNGEDSPNESPDNDNGHDNTSHKELHQDDEMSIGHNNKTSKTKERGLIETKQSEDEEGASDSNNHHHHYSSSNTVEGSLQEQQPREVHNAHYDDEDAPQIRIPVPGLPMGGSCFLDPTRPQRHQHDEDEREMRLAPGLCTICLCNYKVGSDIVWSSNEACDHHFHASCIEKWLMKQREGPLCPICRRDFIVDPLDLLEEEENNNHNSNGTNNNNNGTDVEQGIELPVFHWDPATLDLEDDELDHRLGPIIVTAPGDPVTQRNRSGLGADDTGNDNDDQEVGTAQRLEEGLRSRSDGVGTNAAHVQVSNNDNDNNDDNGGDGGNTPSEAQANEGTEDGQSIQL